MPMAISDSAGQHVLNVPLATVVIGGLFSATFLTLIVILYCMLWLNRSRVKEKNCAKLQNTPMVLSFLQAWDYR
jgi:cobalt-zinc-cadmium resistance protein CzcA